MAALARTLPLLPPYPQFPSPSFYVDVPIHVSRIINNIPKDSHLLSLSIDVYPSHSFLELNSALSSKSSLLQAAMKPAFLNDDGQHALLSAPSSFEYYHFNTTPTSTDTFHDLLHRVPLPPQNHRRCSVCARLTCLPSPKGESHTPSASTSTSSSNAASHPNSASTAATTSSATVSGAKSTASSDPKPAASTSSANGAGKAGERRKSLQDDTIWTRAFSAACPICGGAWKYVKCPTVKVGGGGGGGGDGRRG